MNDLTQIRGIGSGSAKALAAAGISSFAALAAIDPANPPEVDGLRAPDWSAWAEAARSMIAEAPAETEGAPRNSGEEAGDGAADTGDAASVPPVAATPPETTAPTPPDDARVLVITGPKRGRWRAGRQFGAEPVRIPLADLSDAERAAIAADPVLSVREIAGA